MSSLVHSRECTKATALSVLLRGGPRRWSLQMWFQELESSVSRIAAEYLFSCCRTRGRNAEAVRLRTHNTLTPFSSRALACASRNMLNNSIFSPCCPHRQHVVRWPRYCTLAAFSERAAREQRSQFSTSACTSENKYSSSSCVPPSRTVRETEIQAPGTTFPNFSDEVRPEGGHRKCGRFGKLT